MYKTPQKCTKYNIATIQRVNGHIVVHGDKKKYMYINIYTYLFERVSI